MHDSAVTFRHPPICRQALRRWALLALLLASTGAQAQLMVHPTRIVLEKNQRTAQLEIINNSSESGTYTIALVNRRMSATGEFLPADGAEAGERFADGMLRYSPRRITLAAGTSQVVRIMARKPADLAPGEYRSHLLFVKQPNMAPAAAVPAAGAADGISVTLTALVGVSVPVILRHGATSASVSIGALSLAPATGRQPSALSMDLQRSGNQSAYGDLVVSFTPNGRAPMEVGKAGGVAVYVPNARRQLRLPLTPPAGVSLAHGRLSVSFRERPEHGGALLAEAALSLP